MVETMADKAAEPGPPGDGGRWRRGWAGLLRSEEKGDEDGD